MNRGILESLTFAVMTLLPAAMVFPQSLAEAAKKEQARRKAAVPAGTPKVYTESDLPASPAGTPSPDAAAEVDKTRTGTATRKEPVRGMTGEESMQREVADYRARAAEIKGRIARAEALVQQLGNHPTGGGKVCRIPEGAYKPGVTAPQQVVCPYQMESRYDEAKRLLETVKAELVALQNEALRRGIAF